MASMVISSRGGQLGGATGQTYYCFNCDRTLTIIATSDSGLICPICGHVVLEEFETPSPPSPPLPTPPPRSTTMIDPQSFFPTSDTDSDIELSDPLPPPPPPIPFFITTPTPSTARETILPDTVDHLQIHSPPPSPPSGGFWDYYFPFDTETRHIRTPSPPPPPLPLVSVVGQRSPCPRFPLSSTPTIDNSSLSPPEENDTTQYGRFENGLDALLPPLPPPSPREQLLQSPPLSPSTSSDIWESFFTPSTEPEPEEGTWDYFAADPEVNIPNNQWPSEMQPPPPPPPPWLQPLPMEGLLDMKMTKMLVSEWECHQCSICIDNFELNQKVKLTPCNHLYHSDCLLRWLDLHKSCPVCRCKLPSQ